MVCKCAIGLSSIEYLGFCAKDGKLTMSEENVNTTVEAQTRDNETGLNVFRYHWILQEIHILFCVSAKLFCFSSFVHILLIECFSQTVLFLRFCSHLSDLEFQPNCSVSQVLFTSF